MMTPRFINWEVIKEQQASVDLPNVRMIKTDDLELGDAVHLTVESYLEVGRRFAEAYLGDHYIKYGVGGT